MSPADLQTPERGSAPVEDPAVVAAKEAAEAAAAWSAYAKAHPTRDDEKTPEYRAVQERSEKADEAFSAAPVTSVAGALTKLRALAKDITEDSGTDAWELGHVKTVTAFLEGPAGVAQAEPLVDLWAERNHLLEKSEAADKKSQSPDDVHQCEHDALDTEAFAIEARIANTVAVSLAGLLVQARLHGDLLKDGCSWIHTPALTRNVVTALERMGGCVVTEPDPAVAALAKYKVAKAAEDALSDSDLEAGTPEFNAINDRHYAAMDAVVEAVPTSMAGMAAKIRFLFDHAERGNDLWPPFDEMAKSMLPFLEGAPAPKPDPVVVLFAEWGAINEEVIAHLAAIPEGAGKNMGQTGHVPGKPGVAPEEKDWDDALDRRDAVEQKILETPATSMRGVAVKIRLVTHCDQGTDLTPFYATPAREIDYEKECIVLECEAKAAISALLDAERLAGVS